MSLVARDMRQILRESESDKNELLVTYPQEVERGKTYKISIQIRQKRGPWPYVSDEVPVFAMVAATGGMQAVEDNPDNSGDLTVYRDQPLGRLLQVTLTVPEDARSGKLVVKVIKRNGMTMMVVRKSIKVRD